MFVASPSASAANRIVFWSEGEVGIPKCEAPGEHASTSKLEDSKDGVVIHQKESMYVTLFEGKFLTATWGLVCCMSFAGGSCSAAVRHLLRHRHLDATRRSVGRLVSWSRVSN